jgi:hypothetical protein
VWLVRATGGGAVIALLASRLGYVPMWDGRVYADCIVTAASGAFSLEALRCGGHASHIYIGFMVLAQLVARTSYVPMLVANTVLLAAASVAFARIVEIGFPSRALQLDRALLTAAFMLQPAILAAVIQPGLDFPLVPEFLWCLLFLLQRRTVPAILMGIALAFTKETGVLLYGVLVACYALWFVLRGSSGIAERIRGLARMLPLAVPLVVFAVYVLYRSHVAPAGTPVIWNATTTGEGFLHQFLVPRLDLYLVNYLVMVLFMNFAWLATAFIGFDAFVGTVHAAHRLPRRAVSGANAETIGFFALLTVAVGYAITRFATFGNSRYLVVLMALVLLPFMASLVRLRVPPRVRQAALGTLAIALLVSSVRTVDPVSRRLYGTFPVGSNEMLHMTRITDECCGLGRDQLVYSLEFTSLDALTQRALGTLPQLDSATLVVPDSTNWSTIGPLDARTHRRTLARTGIVTPKVIEPRDVLAAGAPPARLYYFALPYASAARGLRELLTLYDADFERQFRSTGYTLPVYSLSLRDSASRRSSVSVGVSSTRAGSTR